MSQLNQMPSGRAQSAVFRDTFAIDGLDVFVGNTAVCDLEVDFGFFGVGFNIVFHFSGGSNCPLDSEENDVPDGFFYRLGDLGRQVFSSDAFVFRYQRAIAGND